MVNSTTIALKKITCYLPHCPKDIQFLWVYGFNCIVRIPRKPVREMVRFKTKCSNTNCKNVTVFYLNRILIVNRMFSDGCPNFSGLHWRVITRCFENYLDDIEHQFFIKGCPRFTELIQFDYSRDTSK